MDKARVDQISTLLIQDQLRRKGMFNKNTLLDELGDGAPSRLGLSLAELIDYARTIIGETAAELEPAVRLAGTLERGLHELWKEKERG